jgi:hypothetical protein
MIFMHEHDGTKSEINLIWVGESSLFF